MKENEFSKLSLGRDRERFLLELVRELSIVLEETVGESEAEGLVSIVGGRIGEMMYREYNEQTTGLRFDAVQVANMLVDLKRRIGGCFSIEAVEPDKIILVNDRCPFGDFVKDRRPLCMMTSNVFGRIAARNFGFARVELAQTIANGDPRCRVVVHLTEGAEGREYHA